MFDEETDEFGAKRYERTADRDAYRSGHYRRKPITTFGENETSADDALIEMYLAGVSTRRIEDASEILWDSKVSVGTVSNLSEKAFASVDGWRGRPLEGEYPYVYVDGIYLKRSWGESYENVAVMIAVGVIGCAEGFTESKKSWRESPAWLKGRKPKGACMTIGDKTLGMLDALEEVFPEVKHQRCTVRFYRNVFGKVPKPKRAFAAKKLKAIYTQESPEASMKKAEEVVAELDEMKLAAAKTVCEDVIETLACTKFPMQRWVRIRTNNAIERLSREIRRWTRVVGTITS